MGRKVLWGAPAALYLLFFVWYTDFGGPLRPGEIEAFAGQLRALGFSAERIDRIRGFMESDTGRAFVMVNVLDLASDPPDVEGAAPGESASRLMDRYMEHMLPELLARACHPLFMGESIFRAMDLVGVEGLDHPERWTTGALMRYRSRRALMEIVTHPDMLGRHEFKVAALEKTIAFPVEPLLNPADARLLLGVTLLAVVGLVDLVVYRRG